MTIASARRCPHATGALLLGAAMTLLAGPGDAAGESANSSRRATPAPADLVLTNGIVRTESGTTPLAEAVAVARGAIVYVGTSAGARAWQGPATEVIDLHGRTLLPGLADTHVHPALGEFLNHRLCDVHAYTVEEGFAKLRHCAEIAPAGDWVVGYGWYDLDNPAFDSVTRAQLDALVPDRKLAVISKDIHTLWANSRTLREFGIGHDTPSPAGGEIVRDAGGEPTGMLIDAANHAVTDRIQHDSPYGASTAEISRSAMAHLNSLGITSILDAFVDADAAETYRALDHEGKLTMRVSLAVPVLPSNYRTEIPRIAASRAKWQSPHVRLDFIKVLADGNPEVGLSSLLSPDGHGETATPGYYTQAQMTEVVALAEKSGLSVFVHAIGDGAARQVLDAISAARSRTPATERRHTLTHLCWVADSDLPRFRLLGVIANIQEGWLAPAAFGGPPGYDYARSTAAGPIGPWLGGRLMPYRPLKDAGARLAAGSDWFYTEENPWRAMQAGATSRDPGSAGGQPMIPNHALDLPTLLRARTADAAYQLYLERRTGTITVGKRADLIVVDRDPLRSPIEQLHQTAVDLTLLDGKVVYRRPAAAPASH
jgi:predicted amidohydrolase YtcJ